MTLAEIADRTDLPARTIRFYIARGLVDGPVKGGRSAEYSAEHVARLERIKRLQAAGRTLLEIARELGGTSHDEPPVAATAWWQHAVADDVMVWVRADASPWRSKRVRSAMDEFARRVRPADEREKETK